VSSPSVATPDQQAPSSSDTTDTAVPFLAPLIPSRITDPLLLRRRQQWQQITEGKEEGNRSSPHKIINPTTSAPRP